MSELTHVVVSLVKKGGPLRKNAIKLIPNKESNTNTCAAEYCAILRSIIERSGFKPEYGKVQVVTYPNENADNLILFGIGDVAQLTNLKAEELGGDIYKAISSIETAKEFDLEHDLTDALAIQIAHGIELKSWKFDKYMSDKKPDSIKSVHVHVSDIESAQKIKNSLDAVRESVCLTRTLISEPANVIYPETFVRAVEPLSDLGLRIKVLDKDEITKNNMNALLAVAQGSNNDPRVLVLEWHGNTSSEKFQVGLVGKGVTFDSGGLDLKGSQYMLDMKTDMSGAAVVVGVMRALAARKANTNVVGICGLVENMPSGTAQKTGDIVTAMSGTTIEVLNTDAEGRMVLADCLTYVQEKYSPETVIDLATLTGAITVALGDEYAGMFSNCDETAAKISKAGDATGEKLWRMPLCKRFEDAIKSDFADIMNIAKPGTGAGSSTAAHFLKKFIMDTTRWIHLDIAGTAYRKGDGKLHQKGATGFGVRLLNRFIEDNY